MPVYDYECRCCGWVFEVIEGYDARIRTCPSCYTIDAHRIISQTGQYCGNQDASWLKSSADPVDPESQDPVDVEFRRNPTRENRNRWMRHHGKIEYEPGMPTKPAPTSVSGRELFKQFQKRNRIEVNR